jgi:hypothetical protein
MIKINYSHVYQFYTMDFGNLMNISGIVLEIIGFVLILKATKPLKQQEGGAFASKYDHAENVMSIVRPRSYRAGIGLVIGGLAIQIIPSMIPLIIVL